MVRSLGILAIPKGRKMVIAYIHRVAKPTPQGMLAPHDARRGSAKMKTAPIVSNS